MQQVAFSPASDKYQPKQLLIKIFLWFSMGPAISPLILYFILPPDIPNSAFLELFFLTYSYPGKTIFYALHLLLSSP